MEVGDERSRENGAGERKRKQEAHGSGPSFSWKHAPVSDSRLRFRSSRRFTAASLQSG